MDTPTTSKSPTKSEDSDESPSKILKLDAITIKHETLSQPQSQGAARVNAYVKTPLAQSLATGSDNDFLANLSKARNPDNETPQSSKAGQELKAATDAIKSIGKNVNNKNNQNEPPPDALGAARILGYTPKVQNLSSKQTTEKDKNGHIMDWLTKNTTKQPERQKTPDPHASGETPILEDRSKKQQLEKDTKKAAEFLLEAERRAKLKKLADLRRKVKVSFDGQPTVEAKHRLSKDYVKLCKEPVPYIVAQPCESNILHWEYLLAGPEDTPYEGGVYWGSLKFPTNFPFNPPKIMMHTPNGRFKPGSSICLSLSHHHPEAWKPVHSVGSILISLLSFLTSTERTGPGMLSPQGTASEKKVLAKQSLSWTRINLNKLKNGHFLEPDSLFDAFLQNEDMIREKWMTRDEVNKIMSGSVDIDSDVDLEQFAHDSGAISDVEI